MKCPGVPTDIPVPQKLENLPVDDILNPAPMRPFDMSACPDRQGRYDCFPTIHRPIIAAVDDAAAGLDLVQSLHELQVRWMRLARWRWSWLVGKWPAAPEHFAADRLWRARPGAASGAGPAGRDAGANLAENRPFARRDGRDRGESRRACDAGGGDLPDVRPRSAASTAPTTAPPSSPRCSARRQRSRRGPAVSRSGVPCPDHRHYRRRDLGLTASMLRDLEAGVPTGG